MKQILKYLNLKYFGDWMNVYNSLQRRESVNFDQLTSVCDKVNYDYITLIDDNYPETLKSIYKPPFGLYVDNGNYGLINKSYVTNADGYFLKSSMVTVFADPVLNKAEIVELAKNNIITVWYNLSPEQYQAIIAIKPDKNIFVVSEMKNNFIPVSNTNLVLGEVYEKNPSADYSNQLEQRIYMGLSHNILILRQLSLKEKSSILDYVLNENINVFSTEKLISENSKDRLFEQAQPSANVLKLAENSSGKELVR